MFQRSTRARSIVSGRTRHNDRVADALALSSPEREICARLMGGAGALSDEALAAARTHRVHRLIANGLPPQERDRPAAAALLRELRTAALFHDRRERLLRGVLRALTAAGLRALLIKGAALAYTAYPAPWLRPRVDIDLLVHPGDLDASDAVLRAEGWTRDAEPDHHLAAAQRHYRMPIPGQPGQVEHLDLHWRPVNPPAFATLPPFDAWWDRAVPLPALDPAARTAAPDDALLLACVHLAAHHGAAIDLLWLLDVHRVAVQLTAEERARFAATAARAGLRTVCARVLGMTVECYPDPRSARLLSSLRSEDARERTALFSRSVRPVRALAADLAALGWRDRVRLLREHLLPPRAYLRAKYPRCPGPLIPFAAVYRVLAGLPRWLTKG